MSNKTQQAADEIAACASMARADGQGQIADMLSNAANLLGWENVDAAKTPLRVAHRATERFDRYQSARMHTALAVEAFQRRFGEL